jgi:hypothetical protein
VGDVNVREDRLVELASGRFAGVEVQIVGVLEQVQVRVEERLRRASRSLSAWWLLVPQLL